MNTMHHTGLWTACTALAAALVLTACSKPDSDATVGQQVDSAVASARQVATEAKSVAKSAAKEVTANARTDLDQAAEASKETTQQAAKTVTDAAITAAINAGIAKDPDLSVRRINVDTKEGHVVLYGSAPSEAARQRAQQIASAEQGVTAVDNKLAIEVKQ
jgi:osmotically-inducible protein OsmY